MSKFRKFTDTLTDQTDKVISPSKRAGLTLERVANMSRKHVKDEVIICQLNANSKTGNKYSSEHIDGFKMLYADAKTRVGVSKTAESALIKDQQVCDTEGRSELDFVKP